MARYSSARRIVRKYRKRRSYKRRGVTKKRKTYRRAYTRLRRSAFRRRTGRRTRARTFNGINRAARFSTAKTTRLFVTMQREEEIEYSWALNATTPFCAIHTFNTGNYTWFPSKTDNLSRMQWSSYRYHRLIGYEYRLSNFRFTSTTSTKLAATTTPVAAPATQQITIDKVSPVMLIWHPMTGMYDDPPPRTEEQYFKKFFTRGRRSGYTYKKTFSPHSTPTTRTWDAMYTTPNYAGDIRAYLADYELPIVELDSTYTPAIPKWQKCQSFDFSLFPKEIMPAAVYGSGPNRETTGNVHMLCDFVAYSRWEFIQPIDTV